MGQAKKRGSHEERLRQAIKRYNKKLEELSQYGLTVKQLDELFKGDERIADHYLEQVAIAVSRYDNVVDVRLRIKPNNELAINIGVAGNKLDLVNEDRKIYDSLREIKHKKPNNKDYSMKFATIDKDTLSDAHPNVNPFNIPVGESEDYFKKIISEEVPDIKEKELNYYAELLAIYSNHPVYIDRTHSFFFERL